MESIEVINARLKDVYGLDLSTSLSNYRIVWTSSQYETRCNEAGFDIYNSEGIFLRTEFGPKEVEKYGAFPNMWVLEVLIPKTDFSILVGPEKYSYEPLFIFGAGNSNPYPIWRAVNFLVRAHKFKVAVTEKKTAKDLLIEEMKAIAKEKEECKAFLQSENPPLATALSLGEAVVKGRSKMDRRDVEIIWASGFFDGEGTTRIHKRNLIISVPQLNTNKEVLERFKLAFGIGVVGTYRDRKSSTGFMSYFKTSNKDALLIISLMSPYLSSEKKKQADDAVEIYSKQLEQRKSFFLCGHKRFGRRCQICHTLANSKRRAELKIVESA